MLTISPQKMFSQNISPAKVSFGDLGPVNEGYEDFVEPTASRFNKYFEIKFNKDFFPQKRKDLLEPGKEEALKNYLFNYVKNVGNKSKIGNVEEWRLEPGGEKHLYLRRNGLETTSHYSKQQTSQKLKDILRHSQVVDYGVDHNQVLDVFEVAKQKGKLSASTPLTILHFDTHSDIYRSEKDTKQSIGSWLNTIIAENNVTDVYWVVPEWTKQPPAKDSFWPKDMKNHWAYSKENIPLTICPKGQTVFVDKESQKLLFNGVPADYASHPSKYRLVKIHKVTVDELKPVKSGAVQLDICGDYFGNSGNDTYNSLNYNYTPTEIHNEFGKMVHKLHDLNIKPLVTTMALSPEYLPSEDHYVVKDIFQTIIEESGKQDYLIGYKHHHNFHSAPMANLLREGYPVRELLYLFDKIDVQSEDPNGLIQRSPDNPKYAKAVDAIKEKLHISSQEAVDKVFSLLTKLYSYNSETVALQSSELYYSSNLPIESEIMKLYKPKNLFDKLKVAYMHRGNNST